MTDAGSCLYQKRTVIFFGVCPIFCRACVRLTDAGFLLYCYRSRFFRPLLGFRLGVREVLNMWESIVGFIGMVLIVYLLMSVIRPEKF